MKPWPNPVYAVDSSFDKLTPEEVQRLKGEGVELFIQCLWTGNQKPFYRVNNLRVAEQGGLAIAGYSSLTHLMDGRWHMEQGRTGVPNDLWEKMVFVAPDVELPDIHVSDILEAALWVERTYAFKKGVPIYTNFNSWTTKISPENTSILADQGFLLWNAYCDKYPDIDYPSLRFGSWEDDHVVGEQWSGGTYVGGQFVDRNTFKREFVFPKEDHMPTEEYDELTKRIDGLQELARLGFNGLQSRIDTVEDGTMEVPIWPVGLVDIRTIRHRGYYAPKQVEKLRMAVEGALLALQSHVQLHNTTGGAIDRTSGEFLDTMAVLLHELDKMLN